MTVQDPVYETVEELFDHHDTQELRLVKDDKVFWVNKRSDTDSECPPYDEELLWVWDGHKDSGLDCIIQLFSVIGLSFEYHSMTEKMAANSDIEASAEIWPHGQP